MRLVICKFQIANRTMQFEFYGFFERREKMLPLIDIVVIILYLIGMLVIGYVSGKDNETQEDYLLAGRSMPWLPISLSITATMISANALIGGPGWAYTSGMKPFMVNITVPLAVFFAVYVTAPVIYHLRVTSIYEYMEFRLGGFTRNLTVAQFFINSLIQVSSMVFIPSLILQTITGWSIVVIVPIIVLISIIYTLLGGIKAVIWTDTVQTLVVISAVILSIYIPLKYLNLSFFDTLDIAKAAGKFNTLDFTFDLSRENTFYAAIFGGTIMWIRYFCFDQAQIQRILTAKSIKGVKRSLTSSAILMNIMYYFMLLIGLFLWVFYDGKSFENSNQVMINFIIDKVPVGITGLIIAGTFAAAMSSVDSLLNSMTTVFIKDIYEKYFYKGKDEVSLKTTMTISSILGIIIIFIVIFAFGNTVKSVLDVVGRYISYFTGPACAAFILAMFTKKANDKGVASGFVLGFISSYFLINQLKTFWLWNSAIGCLITFILGYGFSFIFKNDKTLEEISKYTAMGMRKYLIKNNDLQEDGASIVPFKLDKYGIIILGFFLLQFVILALLG